MRPMVPTILATARAALDAACELRWPKACLRDSNQSASAATGTACAYCRGVRGKELMARRCRSRNSCGIQATKRFNECGRRDARVSREEAGLTHEGVGARFGWHGLWVAFDATSPSLTWPSPLIVSSGTGNHVILGAAIVELKAVPKARIVMPLVRVRHNVTGAEDGTRFLETFGPRLRVIVASSLTCHDEGGELSEEDVEVVFEEASRFDIGAFDINIKVEVMRFPAREADLNERTAKLGLAIADLLIPEQSPSFGLLVKMIDAGWYEKGAKQHAHSRRKTPRYQRR